MDLWAILITGLTVGGLTCLAVQGGLLASVIAERSEGDLEEGKSSKHTLLPVLAFLSTKLVAYTTLGFLLGLFGQTLAISDSVRIIMQILAGIYMLAVAADLLNLHPIFRYAILQPPRFLTRMVRNQSKSKDLFAPALLGFMTIFIPCGTTLAIEALAISSGNPLLGAFTMAVFTIGTIPLFFGVGFLTTTLGDAFKKNFFKVAAVLLVYLGVTTVNAGLNLAGSPITLETLAENSPITIDLSGGAQTANTASNAQARLVDGVQTFDIAVFPTSYKPNYIQVKAGMPVKLNLTTSGGYGCTVGFKIPKLGISKDLSQKEVTEIVFTPQPKERLIWTCSMGMYRGVIDVI